MIAKNSAPILWNSYSEQFTAPTITDHFLLTPFWVRETSAGHMAVGIIDKQVSAPCNLMVVTPNGDDQCLHPIQDGHHAPCSDYLDAQYAVVAESYLSGLALAARYTNAYVAAALAADNLASCVRLIASWWVLEIFVAPDSTDAPIPAGIPLITPPSGTTWPELHRWEAMRWAG